GFDPETGHYDLSSWAYAESSDAEGSEEAIEGGEAGGGPDGPSGSSGSGGAEHGSSASARAAGDEHGSGGPALAHARVERDETLQHPRTVFQILKRHFARYTPEMVREICGIDPADFAYLAAAVAENSGRERTTCFAYAVGWTQHTLGAQFIRTAAILQLLLGNVGRPGGGIMALRVHASIQGSTDVPTLYDLLAGYMPQPSALLTPVPAAKDSPGATTWGEKRDASSNVLSQQTLQAYIDSSGQKLGWWSNTPAYIRSLLQAWYGDAANEEEGNCSYRWIPKITGDHSHLATSYAMLDGKVKGYLLFGQNPAAGSTHATMQRKALEQLDWMVVRDLYEV